MKESLPAKWIKVSVNLQLNTENHKGLTRYAVRRFETEFHVEHLYYARYTNLEDMSFEISALFPQYLPGDNKRIERQIKKSCGGCATKVKIEERGTGSLAHAHAYQAVKNIEEFPKDLAEDTNFLDVLHWMCNMRGLDYIREARAYSFAALRIMHQQAMEGERNFHILRQFNARSKMMDVAERISILMEKDLAPAKKTGPASPARRHKKPAAAAPGKVKLSPGPRSSGSTRRGSAKRRPVLARSGK